MARPSRWLPVLFVTGIGVTAGLAASWLWDTDLYDRFLSWSIPTPTRATREADAPALLGTAVFIVDVSDPALRHRITIGRQDMARVVAHLAKFEPAAVVMDIMFADDRGDPAGTRDLARAIRENGRVVLGVWHEAGETGEALETIPLFAAEASDLGVFNIEVDDDLQLRFGQHLVRTQAGPVRNSLSLLALRKWAAYPEALAPCTVERSALRISSATLGRDFAIPVDERGRTPIYFRREG